MSDRKSSAAPASGGSPADRFLRLTPPVLGILLALFYALAMARDFDFSIGHFEPDSVFFGIAVVLGAAGVLLSVLSWILYTSRTGLTALPAPSALSVFGGFLGAVLSAALCLQNLLNYSRALAAENAESLSPAKLFLVSALLGLFLAAALVLSLSIEARHRWYALICTLFGTLSVNIAMFGAYFDFSLPLNSPVRNFTTLCQASVLLFLLGEARISLSAEDGPGDLPAGFQIFVSSACAVFGIGIGGGGTLWRLIRSFFFGGEIVGKTPEPNLPILRLALYLALGIMAADRLLHLSPRRLTPEEIAERRRKARDRAREKARDKAGDLSREENEEEKDPPASGNENRSNSTNSSEA